MLFSPTLKTLSLRGNKNYLPSEVVGTLAQTHNGGATSAKEN